MIYLCIALLSLILILYFRHAADYKMTTISFKGRTYKIRQRSHQKMQHAAQLLHAMETKKNILCDYIQVHYAEQSNMKRLLNNRNVKLEEKSYKYDNEVAYSINKGDRIGLCL